MIEFLEKLTKEELINLLVKFSDLDVLNEHLTKVENYKKDINNRKNTIDRLYLFLQKHNQYEKFSFSLLDVYGYECYIVVNAYFNDNDCEFIGIFKFITNIEKLNYIEECPYYYGKEKFNFNILNELYDILKELNYFCSNSNDIQNFYTFKLDDIIEGENDFILNPYFIIEQYGNN